MLGARRSGSRSTGPAVDTCGTGGDRAHTVNISTMAAIVVAGAGARVVKHGNRAASSACGSADLLEELGVVGRPRAGAGRRVRATEAGIDVLLRAALPPGAAARGRARGASSASPTVFNFLGPLANPAQPSAQAVGVADARMAGVMAAGARRPRCVARWCSAATTASTSSRRPRPSRVWVVRDGAVRASSRRPARTSGIARADAGDAARRRRARTTPRWPGGSSPARPGRCATRCCSTPRRRWSRSTPRRPRRRRWPSALRAGLERAAEAVDSGAAARGPGRLGRRPAGRSLPASRPASTPAQSASSTPRENAASRSCWE